MKVTIKDVAVAAGVSVATASMALNNKDGVKKETRDKVIRIANEIHYVPDYSARSLVKGDNNSIGLIIPEIQNPFYSAIVDYFTQLAEQRGYTIMLAITNNKSYREKAYVEMFLSKRVNGIIIVPMLVDKPNVSHLDMIRASNVPLVFCTDNYGPCDEPTVMCDFEDGQYKMTNYLLSKGLRKFSFVSTKISGNFTLLRYKGYKKALDEAGIAIDQKDIYLLDHPRYHDAYEATNQIIDRLPEAIICINDIMTIGILKRLVEKHIKVPTDVSLTGFDDMMFSELVQKPLTTVRQPLEEICRLSMEILEKQIQSGELEPDEKGRVHLISPELVIRETTI